VFWWRLYFIGLLVCFFSAMWIWRGLLVDFCLQSRHGGVEAASIARKDRGSGIRANLFWSLGFIDSECRW
jgi:hypothetical protein